MSRPEASEEEIDRDKQKQPDHADGDPGGELPRLERGNADISEEKVSADEQNRGHGPDDSRPSAEPDARDGYDHDRHKGDEQPVVGEKRQEARHMLRDCWPSQSADSQDHD